MSINISCKVFICFVLSLPPYNIVSLLWQSDWLIYSIRRKTYLSESSNDTKKLLVWRGGTVSTRGQFNL